MGFRDNLFDDDNDQFAILEDFYVSEHVQLKKIKMELWVKTLDQIKDDAEEEKNEENDENEALYSNQNME